MKGQWDPRWVAICDEREMQRRSHEDQLGLRTVVRCLVCYKISGTGNKVSKQGDYQIKSQKTKKEESQNIKENGGNKAASSSIVTVKE